MDQVRVSVIVPVYNGAQFLEACLASVTHQERVKTELIIVNDGSTDDSLAIARSFCRYHNGVRVLDQPNRGVAAARNAGLKESSQSIVAFLDQDDTWTAGHLARAVEHLRQVDVVVSNALVMDEGRGRTWRLYPSSTPQRIGAGKFVSTLVRRNPVMSPSQVVARKEVLTRAGGFDATLSGNGADDWDLWLRMSLQNAEWLFLAEPTVKLRLHSRNARNAKVAMVASKMSVIRKNRDAIARIGGERLPESLTQDLHADLFYWAVRRGRLGQAMKELRHAGAGVVGRCLHLALSRARAYRGESWWYPGE